MNDTARDYQQSDHVAIEGLESLFDNPVIDPDSHPYDSDSPDRSDTDPVIDLYWTPQMAAEHFNVSVRTIRRRLKEGVLKGLKINGPNGPEWRIDPVIRTDGSPDKLDSADRTDAGVDTDPVTATTTESTDSISELFAYIREKDCLLAKKEQALQSASATIGYLQAQLEAKDQEIKLLTDSQRNTGWWTRFSKWFFGR